MSRSSLFCSFLLLVVIFLSSSLVEGKAWPKDGYLFSTYGRGNVAGTVQISIWYGKRTYFTLIHHIKESFLNPTPLSCQRQSQRAKKNTL
jgi:hypothetical protein